MNRLGWERVPEESLARWDEYTALAAAARADGFRRVLVCGMGGSSLAPRVLAATAPDRRDIAFHVLDSTNPAAVLRAERADDVSRTLFLVTSKSGTTVETLAFLQYFAARAGPRQFIAITDPGSPLEAHARRNGFRAVLPHPPDVGGRYSALSVVGMLPAALLGLDGRAILARTRDVDGGAAKALGARIAAAARAGRDKLVLAPPPRMAALGPWVEQLVAESSGKDGRGVVPVVGDAEAPTADVQMMREFSGDPLDIGREFLRWEYATWALCDALGVNAFDQPDVEEAKRLARAELETPAAHAPPATLAPAELARGASPGDFLAILAYLPEIAELDGRLQRLRADWGRALGIVTTLGYGPRYLHSTGQLHKGGPDSGLFLVLTMDSAEDADIPALGRSFGQLHAAQARGDVRALLARGRRVAHVHLARPEDIDQLRHDAP